MIPQYCPCCGGAEELRVVFVYNEPKEYYACEQCQVVFRVIDEGEIDA